MISDQAMTEENIIQALKGRKFFGLIECDISVPHNLHDKFSEMCPIFKNVKIGREDLNNHMRQHAEQAETLKQPQRMLIGSLFGKRILLLTPLAVWYLEQGLTITKIYQIIQYIPVKCFEKFGHTVTDARRTGDVDKSKSLLADTCKLIGKSSYKIMFSFQKNFFFSQFSSYHFHNS